MAGHQLYDMTHSLLQSIAAGAMSGIPDDAAHEPNTFALFTGHDLGTVFHDALWWPSELWQPDVHDVLWRPSELWKCDIQHPDALHGSEQHDIFVARASVGPRRRRSCDSYSRFLDQPDSH